MTIREMMINEIKYYAWLDRNWPDLPDDFDLIKDIPRYVEYLNSLDDATLFWTYKDLSERSDNFT